MPTNVVPQCAGCLDHKPATSRSSADGNFNDPDDWIASPVALAILAETGVKDRLVHFGYNDIQPRNNSEW